MTEQKASDNLLIAMETIAQSVVDGVAFDKTILCTITDDSDKENGRYQVTDGSSNFIAYSEVKTFRNKELVYVTVPNGDFSEQKIIIGKKADLEDEPFNYARPFDNLLSCTPNIFGEFSGLATNYKLIANSTIDKEVSPEKDEDKELFGQTLNNFNGGFTRLGLRVKFQSLLTRELIKTGNYGIKLILTVFRDDVVSDNTYYYTEVDTSDIDFKNRTKYNPNFTNEDDKYSLKEGTTNYWFYNNIDNNYMMYNFTGADMDWPEGIIFYIQQQQQKMEELSFIIDTKDMVGNPYAFEVPYTQEKLFDISNINQIKKAEVIFFQDQDFTKVDGTVLPVAQMANLFASDLELYFGYDLSEIQDEFIRLYTFDSLNYQHADNEEENRKEIDLRWAHRTDDKIEIFTKENLESWYNDLFDDDTEKTTSYTLRVDDSETQVENRIYYKMTPTKITVNNQVLYKRYYQYHGTTENSIFFALNKAQPFYPVINDNPLEQYFELRRFKCTDFKQSNERKYFIYEGNKIDPEALLQFKAQLSQKVVEKFPSTMMNSDTKFTNYNFYLFENGNYSPVSILSVDDFIPGKIYFYETFQDIETTSAELDSRLNGNGDCTNVYITLFSPVVRGENDYDIKLNTFQIFKPNFEKLNSKEEDPNYFAVELTEIKNWGEEENKGYVKDTYFYKSYDIRDKFEIRWYRYQLGAPAADEYSGIYWTRIPNQQGGETITCVDADEPAFHCTLYPDAIYNKTEQIKVIILIAQEDDTKKAFYSNTLVFENKDDVISIPTTMQEMALRLQIDDNSNGNYYLYDESNRIIDNSLSPLQRTLTVLFDKENFQSRSRLVNAEQVVWTFPIKNTMMKIDIAKTGGVYAISPTNPSYGTLTINALRDDGYILYYSIEDTFSYRNGNNTITCTIIKDGETFSTTQEFSFGQSGNNGSDYTLVLDLLTSDNMITINPKNNLQAFSVYKQKDYELTSSPQAYKYDDILKRLTEVILPEEIKDFDKELENIYKLADYNSSTKTYELVSSDSDLYNGLKTEIESILQAISNIYNDTEIEKEDKEKQSKVKIKDLFDKIENQYYYQKVEKHDDGTTSTIYKPLKNYIQAENIIEEYDELSRTNKLAFDEYLKGKFNEDTFLKLLYYIPFNQFTLYAYYEDNQYKVIQTSTPVEQNLIRATLYDQSGNLVPGDYEIEWSFFTQENTYEAGSANKELSQIEKFFGFSSNTTTLGDSVVLLQKEYNKLEDVDNPSDGVNSLNNILNTFIIVQATLKGFGDYNLTRYFPIPLRKDYGITRYQGPTEVIYSSTGFPNYYKDEINLYYNNEEGVEETYPLQYFRIKSFYELSSGKEEDYLPVLNQNESSQTYQMVYTKVEDYNDLSIFGTYYAKTPEGLYEQVNIKNIDADNGELSSSKKISQKTIEKYYGNLYIGKKQTTENGQPNIKLIFSPVSTYIQGFSTYAIQYVYNNTEILFTQPILNIQNRYFSSTINKWDGALSIDNDKNTILAKMIGAGRKDSSNRFSGVIMGDWSGNVNRNDGGDVSLANNIGLYGFNDGETSFGFTAEGIGFIGKAGHGRILLDGDNSVITSSNWTMGYNNNSMDINSAKANKGLYIKIDDGFILMRDGKDGHYIKLDVLAEGPDNINNYQSSTASATPSPGGSREYPFVIYGDKNNFTEIGWNGNLLLKGSRKATTSDGEDASSIKDDSGYIYLNAAAEKYPLDINNHFAVAWNGALTISKSNISGFNENRSPNADENKGDIVFTESTSSIIAKDDQRGYFINGSGIESDGLRKHDSTNTTVTNTNTTTSEAIPTYDYTTINTSTTLHDIDSNDNLINSTNFQKKDNPYDYSEINTGFHGLYASPEGDLYLSRKLIIGKRFSATADGYLRAHSALFDDCNANVFEVRYIPDTATAAIDLNKNHIVDSETVNDNKDNQGAKIGKMGWIKGSRGIIDGKEQNTWNLGFKSYKNAGIVCEAYTNLRMEAGNTDGDNDPLHAKRTMYLNAPNEELNAEYALRLTAGDGAKNTTLGYKRANVITRIDIASYGTIDEVARSQIRMGTHGDAIQGNVGVFDPHDSDTTTDYGVEFLLRDPLADANTKQIATGINDNTGGDGEDTGDEEDYGLMALAEGDDDDQSGSTTTTTKYGLARLQVKGLARLSLGPDTSWKSTELANRFLVDVFSSKQVTVPDGLDENEEANKGPIHGSLRMFYDPNNTTAITEYDPFNNGFIAELMGFESVNIEATQGIFIHKDSPSVKGHDKNGNEIDIRGPETFLRFENNGEGLLYTGQATKIHSYGAVGPQVNLLQSTDLGKYYIEITTAASNFNTDLSHITGDVSGNISMTAGGDAVHTSTGETTVTAGSNLILNAWGSNSGIAMQKTQFHVTGPKFYLHTSTVEFTATPTNQTGIYARFA